MSPCNVAEDASMVKTGKTQQHFKTSEEKSKAFTGNPVTCDSALIADHHN
jgi:hypothetical protein